jgi:hypothetical protein
MSDHILNPYTGKPMESDQAKQERAAATTKDKQLLVEAWGALLGLCPQRHQGKDWDGKPQIREAQIDRHRQAICEAILAMVGRTPLERRWAVKIGLPEGGQQH